MKKLILGVVFFAMSLQVGGGALYAVADQKGQVGDTSSYFDQFVQAVGNKAKATKKELSFLWGYLLKKYIHGEKTTQKEDERAKRIQKKLGIAIGALVAIVAIIMGIKWYKNKKAVPLQTQTSALIKTQNDPKDLTEELAEVQKSVKNKALNEGLNNDLFKAVREGKIDEVQKLLSQGADVDARNEWGDTPLYIAARMGSIDMVRLLLGNKASVNAKCSFGGTALHGAVSCLNVNNVDTVKLLLRSGADKNIQSNNGNTPLSFAQKIKNLPRLASENKEYLSARIEILSLPE